MGKKEEIYGYCLNRNKKVTAKEIVDALYPGKQQPYINSVINELKASFIIGFNLQESLRLQVLLSVEKHSTIFKLSSVISRSLPKFIFFESIPSFIPPFLPLEDEIYPFLANL